MQTIANKAEVDAFNYYSLEILDKVGVDDPDQIQIDYVADILQKLSALAGSHKKQ